MRRRLLQSSCVLVALFAAACDSIPPAGPASVLSLTTPVAATATVGSVITVSLTAVDERGARVPKARMRFDLITGDGSITPQTALADANGEITAQWTLGQTAGVNTLVASLDLSPDPEKGKTTITVTGTPSTPVAVNVAPRILRIPAGTTTGTVSGSQVDQFGNKATGVTVYQSRNTNLIRVDSVTGALTVVGTSGTTYVVASGGGFRDSTYVVVLTSTDPPCTGLTNKLTLAVGEVMTTGLTDNFACIAATATSGEYAVAPYFDSSVPLAQTNFTISAAGIKTPGALGNLGRFGTPLLGDLRLIDRDEQMALENRLFDASDRELQARAAGARAWYSKTVQGRAAHRALAVPAIGDKMRLNVNSIDFCTSPDMRTGRVVAVTTHAIVVADSANPSGFTDAEYAAYGAQFDTLSYAVDIANFGEPTDIDNNGRIIIFFTHGVNEAGSSVLGFFFNRDLLPHASEFGSCPGSNVGEIINLKVPDSFSSKSIVDRTTVETMSHEFQHLINGSRRLYINKSAALSEERWLNEGMSHIAEELTFYRVSGTTPRQNLGTAAFQTPARSSAFLMFATDNFARFSSYLPAMDFQSPVGTTDEDDDFETRGAIWSYLRYVADQKFPQNEATLWTKLTNSNTTGLQNLLEVIGSDPRALMHDWTLAVYLDDLNGGVAAKYQMPSWNHRQVMGSYLPRAQNLVDKSNIAITLGAGGTIFARFATTANSDAFVSVQGTGTSLLPKHVLLALVRTK